jgi:hypothetical protein
MPTDALNVDSAVYYLLWAVVWLAPGLVTALIASEKRRSVWLWLVLGVFLSWIALVAIIVLPKEADHRSPAPEGTESEGESEQAEGTDRATDNGEPPQS